MPSLLLRQREQGYKFALEPLDLIEGDDDGGAAVDRVDHGLGLEVPVGELAGDAIIGLQALGARDRGEATVVGAANQGADERILAQAILCKESWHVWRGVQSHWRESKLIWRPTFYGAPDTIRTYGLRLRRANAHAQAVSGATTICLSLVA